MGKIKNFCKTYFYNSLCMTIGLSLAMNLIIEVLARHSLIEGIKFIIESPLVFLFNSCIIFTTYSVALIIKRRLFWFAFMSFWWLALGIGNGVILLNRMTPLTTADFSVLSDGLSIVTNYLSKVVLVGIIVAIVLVVIGFVLLFIFGPKKKDAINYKRNIAVFLVILVGMFGVSQLAVKTKVVDTYFVNLAYAYRDYGVPYSFISSWLNKGIDKPKNYSKEQITSIFDKGELSKDGTYTPTKKEEKTKQPNIIFVQLESFIDPTAIDGYKFSKDPIPNYRKLQKEFSTGYLTVPAVGAGTANTEFESITGISAKFFGPGEYPYKEVLQEETCESIPYDLKDIGYSSHAIHNHRGAFYGRNVAFKNLGFDSFTSLEYMNNAVSTPKNWAKDSILTQQIIDALESTKSKDYVYTISVQGHGKYPEEQIIMDPAITVDKAPSETLKWQYEYYVNQVYEMDKFVKNLTDVFKSYDEDTVIVFYGDHIPALEISEDQLHGRNLFNTEYIIWSNFGLKKEDKDLYAYQIGAEVLDQVGIHEGLITKYNQEYKDRKDYLQNLQALSYDILYGKRYIYGGKNPFKPADMRMGVKDIKIDKIVKIGGKYYIKGKNFTEFSKVSLDGEILNTVYLGPTILGLDEKVDKNAVDRMKISQVEKYNEVLSTTE